MNLQDRLRELRGNRSQREMAQLLDVKLTNYNSWENGKEPNISTLIKIANYHDVTLDYLLGRVDYKSSEYQKSNFETGFTENALKGLQFLKSVSKKSSIDLFIVLNNLLEHELDESVQDNMKQILDELPYYYTSDVFSYAQTSERPISLSVLLAFIADDDSEADQYQENMLYQLRKATKLLSDNTSSQAVITRAELIKIRQASYNLQNKTRDLNENSQFLIASNLLTLLRNYYFGSTVLKKSNIQKPDIAANKSKDFMVCCTDTEKQSENETP